MQYNSNDYKKCINLAIDNAKERIKILDSINRKCVIEEYKEWINEGFSCDSVLLFLDDPII